MAKMFGFLDFTRAGPGVDKNAPKKRSFVVFFEILKRKFWNLLYAGLLFALVNLPLVTRGWADAGLTFVTRAYSREKHAFVKEDFFETIRKNRGQALLCGIINLVVTAVLVFNIFYYSFQINPTLWRLLGVKDTSGMTPMVPELMDYIVMASTSLGYILFTFMKYYIPFLVITFRLTTKQVYRNAMILSMAGLKRNLLISVVLIAIYTLFILLLSGIPYVIVYILVLFLWIFVLPPVRSLLIQFTIFPIIKELMIDPYYRENPDADKQQRLDLNLDVEESVSAEDAPVFTDVAPTPEAEKTTIPRQYSEADMKRARRRRATQTEDDDGTI